jgi:hypothetical protein
MTLFILGLAAGLTLGGTTAFLLATRILTSVTSENVELRRRLRHATNWENA